MATVEARLGAALADRYRIEGELGQGGMATVYLALDLRHQRRVAIKVLKPELAAVLGAERFLREIETTANLRHPHILPLYDSGRVADEAGEAELLYYVMPRVEGESLRDRLNRDRQLPLEEAVQITREIGGALGYAHSRGTIHRDIKPENILLESGQAVVADFGIARAVRAAGGETLTGTGMAVGTPQYMSPEQAAGEASLDGRSDLYSLGCVLYEMLAGQPPFTGPTVESVVYQHLSAEPPPVAQLRPAVPPAISETLRRALAKLPADRFATTGEFVAALQSPRVVTPAEVRSVATGRIGWRRAGWIAAALVPVIAGAFLARRLVLRQASPAAAPPGSVAVLYFDSQSPDTADVYLADGLTEEITLRLGNLPRLAVKSRYAVRRYRGMQVTDPAGLGRALGVEDLVNGSVRRAGHHLRVTVELVRATTGLRIWGNEYDGTDDDLLTLEGDVAGAIAGALAGRLAPAERATLARKPTESPQAYDHFLLGNYFLAQRSSAATARALAQYESALGIDSTFARAWARAAVCYALMLAWEWQDPVLSRDSMLARGVRAAGVALARDSLSSDAWMATGMFQWFLHPDTWGTAPEALTRSVALDSGNAEAHNMLGVTWMSLGRDSAAAAAFRRALALDPLRPITLARLGELAWLHGSAGEAFRYLDSAAAVAPGFELAYMDRAQIRLIQQNPAAADSQLEALWRVSPGLKRSQDPISFGLLASVRAEQGDTAAARSIARELEARQGTIDSLPPNTASFLALAELAGGARERAIEVLDRARPRSLLLTWNLRWQNFDPIRSDPRVRQIFDGTIQPAAYH